MTAPRPPAPLPAELRDLLATYREAQDIPPHVEERIWSVVGADEPAAVAPRSRARAEPDDAASRPSRRTIGWVGFTVAAAAVLIGAWALGSQRAQQQRLERTPGSAVMQGEPRSSGAEAREGTRPSTAERAAADETAQARPFAEPETMPSAQTPAARQPPPTPDAPRSRPPSRPQPPEPTTPEPSGPSVERELIARAWRSLAQGDEASALTTAAEHQRRFSDGLLAPEREAIEVIARCRRGDADASERAAAFHRAHPRSPLASRVDEACSGAVREK